MQFVFTQSTEHKAEGNTFRLLPLDLFEKISPLTQGLFDDLGQTTGNVGHIDGVFCIPGERFAHGLQLRLELLEMIEWLSMQQADFAQQHCVESGQSRQRLAHALILPDQGQNHPRKDLRMLIH